MGLLAKRAGCDRIMVGTDYPASGDIIGGAVRWIENTPLFSAEEKEQILWRNAARFLGLDDHMAAPTKPDRRPMGERFTSLATANAIPAAGDHA